MRGTAVTLYEQTLTGYDSFNAPIYTEKETTVYDVLIGEPTTDDITTATELFGKTLVCMLGIPKGDTHDWTDKKISWVDAYGETHYLQTFGFPITGIEANIPTRWHKKVRCAAYGG